MVKYYLNNNKKIRPINRLDRDTSGIVVFAKNEELKRKFQDNWDSLVKMRKYYAVINGTLDNKEDTINNILLEAGEFEIYVGTNCLKTDKISVWVK